MHILQITPELSPIAKVGGLADVLHGLSKELLRQGHTVEIFLPKYDCLNFDHLQDLKVEHRDLFIQEGKERYNNTIWTATLEGMTLFLLEPHHPHYYFSRGVIYGCHDDIDRFTYFSKAVLHFLFVTKRQPSILHIHDWQTALIPVLQKELYTHGPKCILTLHNLEHQGRGSKEHLTRMGLEVEKYRTPDSLQDPSNPQLINLLKGGIVFADALTTVSPNYEQEIQTPDGGFGLQETLVKHRHKLTGILNGIDEEFWDPERDPHLIQRYPTHSVTEENLPHLFQAKADNKKYLLNHFRLKNNGKPLVACVSRLVPQKGPELILYALKRTLELNGQFLLLGSTPVPAIRSTFEALSKEYESNENAGIALDQDEALAHLFFAAADLFIIPSLFEPCGLTQLISLRYGTVPIARMTGGLKDTVFDVDTSNVSVQERNGFTFDFPDTKGVDWALGRALSCYINDKKKWNQLILNGTRKDLSWKASAQAYIKLYKNLS